MNKTDPAKTDPAASNINEVIAHPVGRKYVNMNGAQKLVFLAKLAVCIATFGFAFPNVQHD